MDEEIDYLKSKVEKLEEENRGLRLKKDPKDKVMKLEQEVCFLKEQIEKNPTIKVEPLPTGSMAKTLNP